MILHLDLFAGIGGFSYAMDCVWNNVEHVFVEIDEFCREVLRKHWSNSKIFSDIYDFGKENLDEIQTDVIIATGGFPCQPFSVAGVRKGTSDERYLWDEMLRVIKEFRPRWIVGENVNGLLTIQDGLVFEQILSSLENEDYEVQSYIIPACAVGAPHRRDRIWMVAHNNKRRWIGSKCMGERRQNKSNFYRNNEENLKEWERWAGKPCKTDTVAPNPLCKRLERDKSKRLEKTNKLCSEHDRTIRKDNEYRTLSASDAGGWREDRGQILECESTKAKSTRLYSQDWTRNWEEVALERCVCELDDGISRRMVRLPSGRTISYKRWEREGIEAFGNAIVPQVAIKIFEGIKAVDPKCF